MWLPGDQLRVELIPLNYRPLGTLGNSHRCYKK